MGSNFVAIGRPILTGGSDLPLSRVSVALVLSSIVQALGAIAPIFTSVFSSNVSTRAPDSYRKIFGFQFMELFELKFVSSLQYAVGSQISPLQNAVGNQVKDFC